VRTPVSVGFGVGGVDVGRVAGEAIHNAAPLVNFDGKAMSESELARANGVRYTPTIQFFPESMGR
jgi:hypothetical protein